MASGFATSRSGVTSSRREFHASYRPSSGVSLSRCGEVTAEIIFPDPWITVCEDRRGRQEARIHAV